MIQKEKNRQVGLEKAKAIIDVMNFMFLDKEIFITKEEKENIKRAYERDNVVDRKTDYPLTLKECFKL